MEQKQTETITVATRITRPMFKGIQTVLATNAHINTADYVRDLIRKDLEKRGVNFDQKTKEASDHE